MRQLVLGTAGHIDHGKTTLVRALTGTDTDRLPEEKRRGITIDLGFAALPLSPDLQLGIVDVPGHEAFVRNMLAGATGIDLALLVVAADEGVMPQTREHLAILDLLGVRAGVVALTKSDLVESEWLELVVDDLRETLAGTAFAAAPIVPVSAVRGSGLDELRAALLQAAEAIALRRDEDLFRLPVDRVFTVRGTGTVVTGTVWSGSLRADATVRVLPADTAARVRALQVHGNDVPEVGKGMRAAVALAGLGREAAARGATLVTDPCWVPASILTARVRMLPDSPRPLRTRQPIRFHLGTAEAFGRVKVLEPDGEIPPGGTGWAQIRLAAPVIARAGDRFVLRSFSPVATIGGGVVAEPAAAKRKRFDPETRARLAAIVDAPAAEGILACVHLAGAAGVALERLPVVTPHTRTSVDRVLSTGGAIVRVGERALAAEHLRDACDAIRAAVARAHAREPLRPGSERAELRRHIAPSAAPGLGDSAIDRLVATGELELRDGLVALTGFRIALSSETDALRSSILQLLREGGLAPPLLPEWPPELLARAELRELLRLLESRQEIVAVAPDLYLHPAEYARAVDAIHAALEPDLPRSASELRDALGVSRKYLIPLLEHFDRVRITRRVGDKRLRAAP